MSNTKHRYIFFYVAIALAYTIGFAFGTLPVHAQEVPAIDSFDNWNQVGWQVPPGFSNSLGQATSSNQCYQNNCIYQSAGSNGNIELPIDFSSSGDLQIEVLDTVNDGSVNIRLSSSTGTYSYANPIVQGVWRVAHTTGWHSLDLYWQSDQSTGLIEVCQLEDDNNEGDCTGSWSDTVYPIGTPITQLGIQTGIYTAGSGDTYGDLYLDELYGSTAVDTNSYIIGVTPLADSVASTSLVFQFGAEGVLGDSDYQSGAHVYLLYQQVTGAGVRGNSDLLSGGSFTWPLSSAGTFNFSSTTVIQNTGEYTAVVQIVEPDFSIFGIGIGSHTVVSTQWIFTAGTSTPLEHDQALLGLTTSLSGLTGNQASTTSSLSTGASLCVISTSFDLSNCLGFLFTPNSASIAQMKSQAYALLSFYPFGYITRIFTIALDPATTSLPIATVTSPATVDGHQFPVQGMSLTIDPWSTLPGSGNSLIDTTESPDGKTLRQVAEPYWDNLVLFLFILSLIPTVMGISFRVHEGDDGTWSDSESINIRSKTDLGHGRVMYHNQMSRRKIPPKT